MFSTGNKKREHTIVSESRRYRLCNSWLRLRSREYIEQRISSEIVFQYKWSGLSIYGRDPLAGDITRKYIDLKYKASNDPCTTYRAMKLNKPGIDLTGEYICVISTFADEQSASVSMVVYCKYFIIDYLCWIK